MWGVDGYTPILWSGHPGGKGEVLPFLIPQPHTSSHLPGLAPRGWYVSGRHDSGNTSLCGVSAGGLEQPHFGHFSLVRGGCWGQAKPPEASSCLYTRAGLLPSQGS